MMFKQYLQVTKPGIIFGNLISVIGGFLLASKGSIDYPLFIYTLVGVSLVVASGCVFNNYIDRDIDRKMERTKNRVLVKGLISPAVSLVYATLLGIAGFMLLWFSANPLACWLGVMGFVVYVGVYSLYMKRHSVYGTLNRPGFPGECFICELRLPDHRFRWKHNKLFLLLPEGCGPAFPAIVDCYTSPPT